MLHRVVRPFPCSFDGLTLVDLNAGDERDFGSMATGLVKAGLIEELKAGSGIIVAPSDERAVAAPVYEKRGKRGGKHVATSEGDDAAGN